jgi:hypothetical protein
MSARRLALMALMVAVACLPRVGAAQLPARADVVVAPESVTVGQPFTVTIHVHAPAGVTVSFPTGPDSGAWVRGLDPRRVGSTDDGRGMADHFVIYRLAAWNVGRLDLALPAVEARLGDDVRQLSLRDASVFVKSVLPAEKAARVPKPARGIFAGRLFPWWIVAVAAALALAWWLVRRRESRRYLPAAPPSAFENAEREFARVAALGLVEAGERGRFLALMVQAVRDYLAARYPLAELSLTTREVLREVASARGLPHERLAALLQEADLVKFARRHLTTDHALALGREAREVVAQDHAAAMAAAASSPAGPAAREAA